MTKERLFRKTYAPQLLSIAKSDLKTAQALISSKIDRKENIFFHLQQAVEKALKAVLCARGKAVPLVHEILVILDRFAENEIPDGEAIVDWTQFATVRRYEEGVAEFTAEEISGAEKVTASILAWAERQIHHAPTKS